MSLLKNVLCGTLFLIFVTTLSFANVSKNILCPGTNGRETVSDAVATHKWEIFPGINTLQMDDLLVPSDSSLIGNPIWKFYQQQKKGGVIYCVYQHNNEVAALKYVAQN